ncbi:hypothetical protein [Calidifontibacillus oryziterrae]|uniref:hypothetical protein n=1 Tax=Calidifontibacillus oryziterrae TaxID=1191699 RepID=UPI000381FAA5|nr:hypothetical protein [Calidifontibacillus oryziterrae]
MQQYLLNGFDDNTINGIVINLITDGINIVITVLLIDTLMKRHEKAQDKKRSMQKKKEQERLINEIMGNRLSNLFSELSVVYINFIYKKPLHYSEEEMNDIFKKHKEAIDDIIGNVDKYVGAGFRSAPVRTLIIDKNNLSNVNYDETIMSYQDFCYRVFKGKFDYVISGFIRRYISILPEDLRVSIYKIENSIDDFVFVTLLERGLVGPLPTTEEDIVDLKRQLLIIGNELLNIYKIISNKD